MQPMGAERCVEGACNPAKEKVQVQKEVSESKVIEVVPPVAAPHRPPTQHTHQQD